MMSNRVAQSIIVFIVFVGYDFLFREVLFVAVLGTYEIQGANWFWFYGALAVTSACLVWLFSRARASDGPIDGLIFGALIGVCYGMSEFRYFAYAVPGYLPVAIVSCVVFIGQFATAGWALGILNERYAIPQAK